MRRQVPSSSPPSNAQASSAAVAVAAAAAAAAASGDAAPSSPRGRDRRGSGGSGSCSPSSDRYRHQHHHHVVAGRGSKSREAQRLNDAMVYLDGPLVYACAQCRTHLTSHDDIISKSFHGRHGRAYLFDQCVNIEIGPAEDRLLITGMHSVCDISCKRCGSMVGWTYQKAYETSQKYKEGKFIIEKVNLHLEETDAYMIEPPAGERYDRFRRRSMSWGNNSADECDDDLAVAAGGGGGCNGPSPAAAAMVYEYRPSSPPPSPPGRDR